jgi:hypothetical protein
MASGIQAHGAQKRAIDERDKDAAQQARTTGGQSFSHELVDMVGSSDRDTQADSDAEGAGSQGKAFADAPVDESSTEADPSETDAGAELDLQA